MHFKEICKLFGGQRATARVLGKDSSNIRRVCRGAMKLPPTWMPVLKEEAARVAKEMADFSENGKELLTRYKASLALPHVIGTSNDLPTGTYTVGVDVAEENTKDLSCKTWMQKQNGKMVVVKVEHYL